MSTLYLESEAVRGNGIVVNKLQSYASDENTDIRLRRFVVERLLNTRVKNEAELSPMIRQPFADIAQALGVEKEE